MNPDPHPTLHRILPEPKPLLGDEGAGVTAWLSIIVLTAALLGLGTLLAHVTSVLHLAAAHLVRGRAGGGFAFCC